MRHTLKALFFAVCLVAFSTAFAQVNPAHWKFNVKELSPTEVELQFQLKLDDGWHIYSQKSDPNGPIPSEYTFEDNANYKRVGGVAEPKPHEEFDDVFKCTVRSFSGNVTFRQKIKRNTDKPFEVKGSMYYQLCNDGSCIAPDDVPFTFKVPAAKAESGERKAESVDKARAEAQQKAAEEAAKQKAAEEAAKQKAADEAAKQKAAEEAAKQKAAEEAAKQKAAEDAAKQKAASVKDEAVKVSESATGNEAQATPVRRPVVNPYPFDEVPENFPKQQASYYNFTTTSSFNYQVRDRQDKSRVFVSVVMPLNLDKINEISTSKFDIEQRGKKEYKVFEFIQFYEGILMALDELQSRGVDVVLNVVDLTSDKDEDVVAAYNSHNVANSDFIIALLVKKPFHKLAELAKQSQVFVINPFSSREDVVSDNPYVVKYMPSVEGTVKEILNLVASKHKGGNLYVIHSNNKSSTTDEKLFREEFEKQLSARKDIKYTMFDWAANGKLLSTLKTTTDNVIVSLYNQDRNKNTVYANTLLNRLSTISSNAPTLITVKNYLTEYPNVDFDQLQHVRYTTVTMGYLDYGNTLHKKFIDTYKDKFHTEPNTLYAGVAHDIMLYFTMALWQNGAEYWRNPQNFKRPEDMLFPFRVEQSSSTGGYENQEADIYQMVNYKLVK